MPETPPTPDEIISIIIDAQRWKAEQDRRKKRIFVTLIVLLVAVVGVVVLLAITNPTLLGIGS